MLNSSFNARLLRVVLITGESGSGKNHVAGVIAGHRQWLIETSRNEVDPQLPLEVYAGELAQVPLTNLPDELLESELFGHKKGSFTGAIQDKKGLLRDDVKDVLLDEIGDASPAVQGKLLRVIDTGLFRPLGGGFDEQYETDARFLLATHRDLGRLVETGTFREDLFWRTTEFELRVPALREQPENVPSIISYQLNRLYGRALYEEGSETLRERPVLTARELEWASSYAWPGNIRQLRHALVRWLAENGSVSFRDAAIQSASPVRSAEGPDAGYARIRGGVRQLLDGAPEKHGSVAITPGAFIKSVVRETEQEVVGWYDAIKPSKAQIERIFSKSKASSVVTKMSQWRNR